MENKEKKPSIIDKWSSFLAGRKGRPENQISYGKGLDKITIRLPKSVYAQLELVNLWETMDLYPNDFELKTKFINKILPYTTFLDSKVESIETLGYDRIGVLIVMYGDLLLAPLSRRGQEKIAQTIEEYLEMNI